MWGTVLTVPSRLSIIPRLIYCVTLCGGEVSPPVTRKIDKFLFSVEGGVLDAPFV